MTISIIKGNKKSYIVKVNIFQCNNYIKIKKRINEYNHISSTFSKLIMSEDASEMAPTICLKWSSRSWSVFTTFHVFTSPLHCIALQWASFHQLFPGKMQVLPCWLSFPHTPSSNPPSHIPRSTFLKHNSRHTAFLI